MKIPASPLLFASLALTSSTLAAPVARGRESSPSPNPDCDGFDAPARMPAPRAVSGSTAPAAARLAQREEGPKSVMIGRNARQGRKVRRVVSMGNQQKRDDAPAPVPEGDGTVNANGLLDGLLGGAGGGLLKPVGDLLGGVVDTVGGLVDGVGGSLPGGLGDTVRGVVDPLTGHLSDGLKTGTVPGIANGAVDGVKGALDGLTGSGGGVLKGVLGRRDAGLLGQVGQVTNGLPVVGGLTQQVTDGLANGHPVSGLVGTANGLVGTVGNVLPGGLGDTVTGLTGGILGGVGATADGLLSPVVGQNGIVNGLVGDNGALGGLLSPVLGEQGVVDGLLGGNGLVGGVLGDQGVVGGVLGKNGLVGGLLGGGNGGSGLVGGLLGGGGNGGGLPIVGGLLGGGNGPGGGLPIVGGLLGGGGNGGLLGGLLGGSAPKPADNSAKAASALPDPLALIKQQGGVVRDLGNGNFLTTAGGVVQVPLNLAAQLGGLLSQTTQTAQGAVGKVSGLATSSLPGPVAGVAGSAVGAAQGVLGTAAHAASGAVDTASQAVKGATGTVGSATGQAANLASASTPSGIPSGVPASLNGATSTLLGMTGSAVPPVQNLAGSPLSALGDLSKLDLSSLSPADLQQLAQFASGSLPATSALMQNLAVDPSTLSIPTGAQEGQHLPGTAMGGRLAIPTPSGMPLPSGAPGIPDTTFHVLGATPVGAMMGAASHAVPSNIPSSLPSLASVPSVNPYNNPDAASTGKVPSSDAAKALASQIAQNGQKLSDEEYAAKIQALKDQLARMAAAASGTAGDAAGQSASAQLQSLLALSNGLTNADLGKVDGVMLSPHGAAVVPTPAASVPSSIPTTLPSASPSGLANAAAIPSTFSDDLSADAYDAADEYEDCSDCDDDDDEWEEEAYSDDGNVQLLNADVYPNFFSGDNAVLGAQGSAIGLASAANVAAAAVTGAPVASASGLPGQAQVGSAIRSVSSAYLPSATAVVPVPSASASMIPQNSSGLA